MFTILAYQNLCIVEKLCRDYCSRSWFKSFLWQWSVGKPSFLTRLVEVSWFLRGGIRSGAQAWKVPGI